jgi:hypothetical protein
MASMRATEQRSLGLCLFITPFLLIIVLALDMSILRADSTVGLALSETTFQAVFANVAYRNGIVPATPTKAPPDSGPSIGDAS